jgi:hypothetical protein
MVFAINPSDSQKFTTFYQKALSTDSKSSRTSEGVKAGAAIGSIAGVALILAVIFYFFHRHRKNAMAAPSAEAGSTYETQPAMIQQPSQEEWPVEVKPPTPPPGAELHHQSTPGELENPNHPVELHNGMGHGLYNEPVEMWSPTHGAAPSYHPPGYRSIDNGINLEER